MADSFDHEIDSFADKLLAFVAQASDEMMRSLVEVLRATRDARTAGEQAERALEDNLGPSAARVAALERRFTELRASLWARD
jgi:hypothetical protein